MLAAALGACTVLGDHRTLGPAEVILAQNTHLKLPRHLIYLPPEEGVKLMHALGERPGAEVLGVVVTHDDEPTRMLIIFSGGRDARGHHKIELVGWDEAPAARSYIEQLLIAQPELARHTY